MKQRIIIDHRNTNKQLRHYDTDGDYMRLSVDETIARGLNMWSGWRCSAGVQNLYIDYDGHVWICNQASASTDRFNYAQWNAYVLTHPGAQKADLAKTFVKQEMAWQRDISGTGMLGDIFAGFTLPTEWFTCQWQRCGCGADVFLPKAKAEQMDKLAVLAQGFAAQHTTKHQLVDAITDSVAVEPNFPIPYQILWDLGRRCNYDCSYCWPAAHNRDAAHKPLDVMQRTADRLIDDWANAGRIRWNFGGGEPTLHPQFLDFLRYLKARNQWVLVTSNGSRPRKYWKDAITLINSVNLSVHFEFADEAKLLGNIEEMCEHYDQHDDDHWLEIKLMAPPGYVQRAVAFRDMISTATSLGTAGANGQIKGVVSIVPIRVNNSMLADYAEHEIAVIQHQ